MATHDSHSIETEIRERIVQHLAGELALADLEQWVTEATWALDEKAEPAAADLAYALQLVLAEYSRGDREERSVDQALRRLATTVRFGDLVAAVTASATVTERLPFRLAAAGRRSEAAPA